MDTRLTKNDFARIAKVTPGGFTEVPDAEGQPVQSNMKSANRHTADDDGLMKTNLKTNESHVYNSRIQSG